MIRFERQRAFTVVELLVVVGIIGMLLGLLLPAIQAAREASRRGICGNNLKQIGLAVHFYNDANRCFPAGIDYSGESTSPELWSWRVALLPYLEEHDVYQSLNLERGILAPENQNALARPIAPFVCSSDPLAGHPHIVTDGALKGPWTTASYLGVSGSWGLITAGDGELLSPEQCVQLDKKYSVGTRSGALYENSWVDLEDIRDGTSNTLLIGERGVPNTLDSGWLTGPGLADACPGGWTDVVLPFEDNFGRSGLGDPTTEKLQTFHWWSHHGKGANFVLCDGTVRFISYDSDRALLRALSTRAGNEEIGDW